MQSNSNQEERILPDGKNYLQSMVFSIYSKYGPDILFSYPISQDLFRNFNSKILTDNEFSSTFSHKELLQISIKSVSLLLTDYSLLNPDSNNPDNDEIIYGILPYPDIKGIAITMFAFYYNKGNNMYLPATLSLVFHERNRSFVFDNVERIKDISESLFKLLIETVEENSIVDLNGMIEYIDDIIPHCRDLARQIYDIQNRPFSPITKRRRIKILFSGLENTGKTSFLNVLVRRYSKCINIPPTTSPISEPMDFLGTTIIKWDIPGQRSLREEVLKKTDRYLFETDLLFYFIDVNNPRIGESKQFLLRMRDYLENYNEKIPIIVVISKVDEDIANDPEILRTIGDIKKEFGSALKPHPVRFFTTSIFSHFSILNAFSYGLRHLSPNYGLIYYIIRQYSNKNNVLSTLVINSTGLVLAAYDYQMDKKSIIQKTNHSGDLTLKQIFEIAAPYMAFIHSHFDSEQNSNNIDAEKSGEISDIQKPADRNNVIREEDLARIYLSSNALIILHRFWVKDLAFYILLYTDDVAKEGDILKNLVELEDKLRNLLLLYC